MTGVREGRVRANGLSFATLEAGPADAPLALCLHGFPDTARTWRGLLPTLAGVGYHAVAPFARGYAPTDVPADGRYQVALLARDVIASIEALGAPRACVIGHDWGALAAHGAAILAPERVRRLVTLAVPHRNTGVALATSYAQQKRSWYMFFFQSPLADAAVAANDYAFVDRLWRDWSPGPGAAGDAPAAAGARGWTPDPADLEAVKACLRAPGGLAAALGYYRALFDPARQDPALAADQLRVTTAEVPVPTLYLHGTQDGCVGVELTGGLDAAFPKGLRTVLVEDAGHFLHLERPKLVHDAILDFLGPAVP